MHATVNLHGICKEVNFTKTKTGVNMLLFNVDVSSEYKGQLSTKTYPVMGFGKVYSAYTKAELEGAEVEVKGSLTSKPNDYNGTTYHRMGISAQNIIVLSRAKSQPPQEDINADELPF
jgi:hypothetical protein